MTLTERFFFFFFSLRPKNAAISLSAAGERTKQHARVCDFQHGVNGKIILSRTHGGGHSFQNIIILRWERGGEGRVKRGKNIEKKRRKAIAGKIALICDSPRTCTPKHAEENNKNTGARTARTHARRPASLVV